MKQVRIKSMSIVANRFCWKRCGTGADNECIWSQHPFAEW